MAQTKICTKCKEDLLETKEFFYFRKDSNSFKNKCIECCKKDFKKYHKENIVKIKIRRKIHYNIPEVNTRILEEKKEYHSRPENKARAKEYNKKYNEENYESLKKRKQEYRVNPKNKARRNKNARNRRKIDINFKLGSYLRSRINTVLKGNVKSLSVIKLLGCSIKEVKKHLESQFVDGMSWDNHRIYGWHIDHKKPCASFDLSKKSEQLKCFHYTNLQPLWAVDNLKKGDKVDYVTS